MNGCRMIGLWSDDEETEFGVKVAGEQNFRAITCNHINRMFERIVDCSILENGRNWSAILDSGSAKDTTAKSTLPPRPKLPPRRIPSAFELAVQQEL